MAINEKYKPTRSGVKVLTWGVDPGKNNGMLHFFDNFLFGGNVGHASVKVTFPANEEGDRLIKEYCEGEGTKIPYTKRTYNTKSMDGSEVLSEDVYEVTWSWWPGGEDAKGEVKPFRLETDTEGDMISEREAVNFEWNQKWKALIDPEIRRHKGRLGQKIMSYGPSSVIHTRDLSETDKVRLLTRQQMGEAFNRLKTLEILEKRLAPIKDKKTGKFINVAKSGRIILDTTSKLILNRHIKDWQKLISHPTLLNKDDITKLKDNIAPVKSQYQAFSDVSNYEYAKRINIDINRNLRSEDNASPMNLEGDIKKYLENFIKGKRIRNDSDKAFCERILKDLTLENQNDKARLKKICKTIQADALENPFAKDAIKSEQLRDSIDIVVESLKELENTGESSVPKTSLGGSNPAVRAVLGGDPLNEDLVEAWSSVVGTDEKVEEITKEQLEGLLQKYKEIESTLSDALVIASSEIDFLIENESNLSAYLTEGLAPDGVVSLPIRHTQGLGVGVKNGLDVENMLKQMKSLSDPNSPKFNLYNKNCSKTTDSVLEAGAVLDYQKEFFRNKAWGFFGNPQESYNNALDFLKTLDTGKPNIFSRMTDPLTRINGTLFSVLITDEASAGKKVSAAVGILLLAPFTLTAKAIKGLANPLETFRSVVKLMEFATTKPFKGAGKLVQGAIIFTAGVVGIIYAPFALAQKAIVTPLAKLSEVVNRVSPKTLALKEAAIKSEQEKAKFENLDPRMAIRLQSTLDSLKIAEAQIKKSIDQLTVQVGDMNPQKALAEFSAILKSDPNAIPNLSKDANTKVLAYIKKHPEDAKLYQEMSAESLKRVTTAQKAAEKGEPLESVKIKSKELTIHKDTLKQPEETSKTIPKNTEPEAKPPQPTSKGPTIR